METTAPVETKSSRAPLVLGLLLVTLGGLLFLGTVFHWQIWAAPWHFIGPLLLVIAGVSSLWRYFSYTSDQALQGVRRRGGVVWGSFLIFIAVSWFGGAQKWFNPFQFIGKFWPLLLILIGLGKVLDFYRLKGRAQFRFGEVFGVLVIILIGVAAAQAPTDLGSLGPWMGPWVFTESNPFAGPSLTFTEEKSFPVQPHKIDVTNRYGNVHVTRGKSNEVSVVLEKVVYQESEQKAREIANQIELVTDGSNEFTLRVNRRELEDRNYRFKTHLEVRVPEKAAVTVDNSYGSIDANDLDGSCAINSSFGPVRVEAVRAPVVINSRSDQVSVQKIKGTVTIVARRGDVVVSDVTGDVQTDSHQSTTLENIHGAARVTTRNGSVLATAIDKDLFVDGPNSNVRAVTVQGKCEIHNSHRRVELEEVSGSVKIENSYGEVTLRNLKSVAAVDARHNSIRAEGLQQGITINGEGSHISLEQINGPVRINTSMRELEIDRCKGPLDISTRNGNVRIASPDGLQGPVRVVNERGDIALRLAETVKASFDIEAILGSIENDLSEELKVKQQGHDETLRGTLNGGGPLVRLQNRHGKIRLEK
ncbi:MAG TPA: DUF4097 family beta strand repeat-containing protein [Acidobacteriota bacterium]